MKVKVVCIKEAPDKKLSEEKTWANPGDIFTVEIKDDKVTEILINEKWLDCYSWNHFWEHFVILSEFRNNRIDEILS